MALILLTGLWSLLARPPMPLDETRLLSVAWEMWVRGDFLEPFLNGEIYSHKPPLLHWLIHLGWLVFGVSEWWPRVINPVLMLGATWVAGKLAACMWPDTPQAGSRTRWILASALGWIFISQMVLYDPLLTFCCLVAVFGVWLASQDSGRMPWILVAVGMGLGLISKGPVTLVHVLVPALLAPLWSHQARQALAAWYGKVLLAFLGSLAVAALWIIPAIVHGGEEYARAILLHQTVGRMVDSFAHVRPWWVYLLYFPALLLPWVLMPGVWKASRQSDQASEGDRFVLFWMLGSLFVFSVISSKQPHYIVPEIAAGALWIARKTALVYSPRQLAWRGTAMVVFLILAGTAALSVKREQMNVWPAARLASELEQQDIPLAVMHKYSGQLGFAGRLRNPIPIIEGGELPAWLEAHPNGVILTFRPSLPEDTDLVMFKRFPYRSKMIEFWRLEEVPPPEPDPN